MSVRKRLGEVFRPQHQPSDAPDSDVEGYDPATEGNIEPNTAALTEGAPPGGVSGRMQPSGPSVDPRAGYGTSEGEVQNLPG